MKIYYGLAECYKNINQPEDAETFFNRAEKLRKSFGIKIH